MTAAFDLNVLRHLDRAYGANLDPSAFVHRAVWDAARSRIEMHLVSRRHQSVRVGGEAFELQLGEPIVTEHSYKHPPEVLEELLSGAGWRVRHVYPDPEGRMHLWFAIRERPYRIQRVANLS